jgi:hypothetical protein
VNCARHRFSLAVDEVTLMLDQCKSLGIKNIHFTDEDFFYDITRAHQILQHISGKGFHLIALGSAEAVMAYLQTFGPDTIKAAGLEVIEIGFESGDTSVSKSMGNGKDLNVCIQLAEMQNDLPFTIFWLVLTFYMGETITTLNETGKFMQRYGLPMEQVVGRLRTNGTKGGLGQFFQPYHGTGILELVQKKGVLLNDRPVRLIPSYLPNSFLDSIIEKVDYSKLAEALPWIAIYNLNGIMDEFSIDKPIEVGNPLRAYIKGPKVLQMRKSILFAVLARMGVIS